MKTATLKEKVGNAFHILKDKRGYSNIFEAPRLVKVVISSGIGSLKDKKKADLIADRLSKITGQKPATRSAKQSIASFKVRQGDPVGYQVTLRGSRMFGFLDKLVHVVFPRTRDFRGLSDKAIDEMGNFTVGIKEHTVFPETADEDIRDVFGMAVTIVTTSKDKEEAKVFLEYLGFPFKKGGEEQGKA